MSDLTATPHRITMDDAQLEKAALRLSTKTRLIDHDQHEQGISDPGTDAALVAIAYLDLKRERPAVDMTKLRMHPSIQLSSGAYFDFVEPWVTPLMIDDIAAGLSRICRYTGQLNIDEDDIYTVAQHCVLASENCDPDCDPFEALMHDRAESVMNDMASPLKQLLPDYKIIEDRVEEETAIYYGIAHPMSAPCKRIDLRMLCTEKRDLMPGDMAEDKWALIQDIDPLPFTIKPWRPSEARHRFLHRYNYLTTGRIPDKREPYAWPHPNAPAAWLDALTEAWGFRPEVSA